MLLTGENRSAERKAYTSVICPPQTVHTTVLGSNPGLRGEKPMANRLRLLIILPSKCMFQISNVSTAYFHCNAEYCGGHGQDVFMLPNTRTVLRLGLRHGVSGSDIGFLIPKQIVFLINHTFSSCLLVDGAF
jgi:hypothetical protein